MTDTKNTVSDALRIAENFANEYEFDDGESGHHVLSDFEHLMLTDMLNGLFAEEDFLNSLQSLRASIPGGVGVKGLVERLRRAGDAGEVTTNDFMNLCNEAADALDLSPAEGEPVAWQEIADPDTITRSPAYVRSVGFEKFRPLYAAPSNPVISDGDEEHRIEDLRFKAFRTNDPDDRQAYFDAVSKWFQHRHYRYAALSLKPQSGENG